MNIKASDYNVVAQHSDGFVIYNQISGSLVLLDNEQYESFRRLKKGQKQDSEIEEQFLTAGLFIEQDADEREMMARVWNEKKHRTLFKQLTIAPTDRCNLGCVYCYEDKEQWISMSEETQEKTKQFVDEFLRSTPTKKLTVCWFGGEPTLHLQCVENLSRYVQDLCKEMNIDFGQSMVTNGTTLTDHVIERLANIGVRSLQITLDGFKEDHDKSRPFLADMNIAEMTEVQIQQRRQTEPSFGVFLNIIGQEPCLKKSRSSYDAIVTALQRLHKAGFYVSLRVNLGIQNKDRYAEFYEHLRSLGVTEKDKSGGQVIAYPARIFETEDGMQKEEFAEIELKAKTTQHACSQNTNLLSPFSGESCMANKQFSLAISQSGAISKCWHHITEDNVIIGTVDDLDLARNGFVDGYSPLEDAECRECRVLPSCMGGCKQLNLYYENGLEGKKYEGCDSLRWSIQKRVIALYERTKLSINS